MKGHQDDLLTSRLVSYGSYAAWLFHHGWHDTSVFTTLYQTGTSIFDPAKDMLPFVVDCVRLVKAPRDEAWEAKFQGRAQSEFEIDASYVGGAEAATLQYALVRAPGETMPTHRVPRVRAAQPAWAPGHPVAAEVWLRCNEFLTERVAAAIPTIVGHNARRSFKWDVWCDETGGCELAFTAYYKDGSVQPQFDFPRQSPEDLASVMRCGDDLRALFKI